MASNEEESVSEQNGKEEAVTGSGEQQENSAGQIPAGQSLAGENNTKPSQNGSSNEKQEKPYAKNYLRVSKDNLYMIIALWMQDFVDEAPEHYRKVGAVLVLPNDVVYATDCSRGGVHAVQRLLMKHYDKAEGSKMFLSRKPCPTCAKLLVQAKVQRVLFLPFEPEYYNSPKETSNEEERKDIKEYNNTQMKQVDNLFTASAIAQTKFVLQVEKPVLKSTVDKDTPEDKKTDANTVKKKLINQYPSFKEKSEWMNNSSGRATLTDELPWPAFDDKIEKQVRDYFEDVMLWIAGILVLRGRGWDCAFELCPLSAAPSNGFDPNTNKKQAQKLMEIARFLGERTDDPKKIGVGAVIVSPEMEILALGWNGFPFKALYGEFARASGSNEATDDKKYPYVIHAEQNALLMRNSKMLKDSILFVTKPPCNECAPLIAMQGVKTVVVDDDVKHKEPPKWNANELGYDKFPKMVEDGTFICYQTKEVYHPKPKYEKDTKPGDAVVSKLPL